MGPDAMIFIFWMLSFMPAFSLSSFTFNKRLFSSSSLSAIKVVSSAYLSLLIFLLPILILVCALSSPAFHIMYSVYKLNKQGDDIQPWRTPFPILNQSIVPCPVLTVASWPRSNRYGNHQKWPSRAQAKTMYSELAMQGSWPPSFACGRDWKAGKRNENFIAEKRNTIGTPDWSPLAQGR